MLHTIDFNENFSFEIKVLKDTTHFYLCFTTFVFYVNSFKTKNINKVLKR